MCQTPHSPSAAPPSLDCIAGTGHGARGEPLEWGVAVFDFGHGDELDLVRIWQEFLLANGISVGAAGADGLFGSDTRLATMEFQHEEGLPATGHVDGATWERAAARLVPPRIPTDLPPAVIDWYRITPAMRRSIGCGSQRARRDLWERIHPEMIHAFSPACDREEAIAQVRAYYRQLEPYRFGELFSMPAAGQVTVHPELRRRLDAALAFLEGKGLLQQAMRSVAGHGGFAIRHAPDGSGLDSHSFATAIDLAAAGDPVVAAPCGDEGFPREEFVFLTGVDPLGPEVVGLLEDPHGRSFDEAMAVVKRVAAASRAFAAAFVTSAALAEAFCAALAQDCGTGMCPEEALALLGRGSGATLQRLRDRIADDVRWEQLGRMGRRLSRLFDAAEAAGDLQALADGPGRVARYGCVNLAPELIAALICREGGRLRWAGVGRACRGAMHFALHADEAAALLRAR